MTRPGIEDYRRSTLLRTLGPISRIFFPLRIHAHPGSSSTTLTEKRVPATHLITNGVDIMF